MNNIYYAFVAFIVLAVIAFGGVQALNLVKRWTNKKARGLHPVYDYWELEDVLARSEFWAVFLGVLIFITMIGVFLVGVYFLVSGSLNL